jgi:quercetin dioxygenase-like cupin family protein
MKTTLLLCTVAGALLAAAVAFGANPPIIGTPLAVGKMAPTTITTKGGSMIVERIVVKPGGDFGWHTHGSPVAVVIQQGTLTVWDKTVGNCAPFTVSKGQSFVEPANHVHRAMNEGSQTVKLYAVYLGIPKGAAPNKPAQVPAGCAS